MCGLAWGGELAVTQTWWDSSRTAVDSDVIFNSNLEWDIYPGPRRPGVLEFRRVAIHEFGHVLGLGHPDEHGQDVLAIMNSRFSDTEAIQGGRRG